MKKLFTFVAVMLLAASVNAVNWVETFDKNGTYIDKVDLGSTKDPAWPFANQWFTGYTGTEGEVEGSQYVQAYDTVISSYVTIRGKKVDAATESLPGLYFANNKSCSVLFSGVNVAVAEGDVLELTICRAYGTDAADANWIGVNINDAAVTVPSIEIKEDLVSVKATIELTAGTIDALKLTMEKKTSALFINRIAFVTPTANENVFESTKATKMVENGQIVIIRNGVKYNTVGAVVE